MVGGGGNRKLAVENFLVSYNSLSAPHPILWIRKVRPRQDIEPNSSGCGWPLLTSEVQERKL